ncbi:hypothetical protein JHV675_52620 [Mycobacterium avium subsp. hominissuis]
MKTFEDLFAELGERARTRPAGSATVAALDGGPGTGALAQLGEQILEGLHGQRLFHAPAGAKPP